VLEHQRYKLDGKTIKWQLCSCTTDVPYGKDFRVQVMISLREVNPQQCTLEIAVGVHFLREPWCIGKVIRSSALQAAMESYTVWGKLLVKRFETKEDQIEDQHPAKIETSSEISPFSGASAPTEEGENIQQQTQTRVSDCGSKNQGKMGLMEFENLWVRLQIHSKEIFEKVVKSEEEMSPHALQEVLQAEVQQGNVAQLRGTETTVIYQGIAFSFLLSPSISENEWEVM